MLSTLLFLSFILHIIAFISIFQLLKKIQQNKKDSTDDIVALLETYLNEIKQENRLLEKKTANKRKYSNDLAVNKINNEQSAKKLSENNTAADIPEMSLQAKILQLHRKGIQADEIAKKLNCGKTEAQLIIKFYTKTDNNA